MSKYNPFFLAVCMLMVSNLALAKEFPVQGRFFAGVTSADPTNANETIEGQGIKKIDSVTQYGFEATYPVLKYLDFGFRYTKRAVEKDEQSSSDTTEFNAKIDQDSVLLVGRVPLLKSDFMRIDGFAGIGGSNTTLKLKTAAQDGEFTRRASNDWFASPYTAVGGSVAVGYKRFFFVVEGGYENNKVDNFSRSGSVTGSIETLDLSGPYISVGLMIDGLSASKR